DVWFDSGSTHETVIGGPRGQTTGAGSHGAKLAFPADLYLEGSDQHRGWFHSSLLVSCMLNGEAPYKGLLTHGFFVDGEGRKMSKSLGNTVQPQKIAGTLGAEILRLWVAATDYSGELSISEEILKRVVESYRRIRNTLRFLLANIADFDPVKDALPVGEWLEIDRYAVAMTLGLQTRVLADYERYEFHTAVARIQNFCSEDLGGFYLDILKDRLYTTKADSKPRRAAQSALHHITQSLLRLIAPILSFTAEEGWRLTNPDQETVFVNTWHEFPAMEESEALLHAWGVIRQLRETVNKHLEEQRAAGKIGSALAAEVDLHAQGAAYDTLQRLGDDLRFVFITSRATLHRAESGPVRVEVVPSTFSKCERCWHYRSDVGADPAHTDICGRCVANLYGSGEPRDYA
ncbi:MAG: class I tRNA ligase family protein, partial [Burkholderiales bacterium]